MFTEKSRKILGKNRPAGQCFRNPGDDPKTYEYHWMRGQGLCGTQARTSQSSNEMFIKASELRAIRDYNFKNGSTQSQGLKCV